MCRNEVCLNFANISRSKQNKKNSEHPFVDNGRRKRVRNFSKTTELKGC